MYHKLIFLLLFTSAIFAQSGKSVLTNAQKDSIMSLFNYVKTDGLTGDDIQNAIDKASLNNQSVYLDGDYVISSTIRLKDNTNLIGSSINTATIEVEDGFTDTLFSWDSNITGVRLENLYINMKNTSGLPINNGGNSLTNLVMSNCTFDSVNGTIGVGVGTGIVTNALISSCNFNNAYGADSVSNQTSEQIQFMGSDGIRVLNCDFNGVDLAFTGTSNTETMFNSFRNIAYTVIFLRSSTTNTKTYNHKVIGNTFENNNYDANPKPCLLVGANNSASFGTVYNVEISNNIFHGCFSAAQIGGEAKGSTDNIVFSNNVIDGYNNINNELVGRWGIYISAIDGVLNNKNITVVGNQFRRLKWSGIRSGGLDGFIISNNILDSCGVVADSLDEREYSAIAFVNKNQNGIIQNNRITNCGSDSAVSLSKDFAGIYFDNANSQEYITIKDNIIIDTRGKTRYGINLNRVGGDDKTPSYCTVKDNSIIGMSVSPFSASNNTNDTVSNRSNSYGVNRTDSDIYALTSNTTLRYENQNINYSNEGATNALSITLPNVYQGMTFGAFYKSAGYPLRIQPNSNDSFIGQLDGEYLAIDNIGSGVIVKAINDSTLICENLDNTYYQYDALPDTILYFANTQDRYCSYPSPDSLNLGTGDFTIIFDIKLEQSTTNQAVIDNYRATNPRWFITFTSGVLVAQFRTDATTVSAAVLGTDDIDGDGWVRIGVVGDRSDSLRLYINGEEKRSTTAPALFNATTLSTSDTLFIGSPDAGASLDSTYISNLVVFRKALSGAEMGTIGEVNGFNYLANTGSYISKDHIRAWWKFNEGAGQTITSVVGTAVLYLGNTNGADATDPEWSVE